jgi:hypothetical protein
MKAPNEKLIETLFTYHALRYLEGSGATVYTPSSREEYRDGYDAVLMGATGFDELYLQFKTPALLEGDGYSFATYEHQHQRLQEYPHDTAFYLTHLFRGVDQVLRAQQEAVDPLDFLHWYVAIEIGRLANVQRFRYFGDLKARWAHEVLFKVRTDKKWEHPKTALHARGWMTGAELVQRFQRDEVGAHVYLAGGDVEEQTPVAYRRRVSDRDCPMSPEQAERWVRGDEKRDWGTALRKNVRPLLPDHD